MFSKCGLLNEVQLNYVDKDPKENNDVLGPIANKWPRSSNPTVLNSGSVVLLY